ncbi:hypothetical protein HJC23_008142 [Cyclotella cryptica]|uniref:RING-type domain-containing protein n=1 Tax=Cyclotella cryptica TaxID=29204 RepID=A0ABD3PIS2_9STRA
MASEHSNSLLANNGNDPLSCPICLSSSDENGPSRQFAKTTCGHIFCASCMEQVLSKPRSFQGQDEDDDVRFQCATRGKCPMCRQHVSLFELRDAVDDSCLIIARNTTVSTWPIRNARYEQRVLGRRIFSDTWSSRLALMVERHGAIGGFGITFQYNANTPSLSFKSPLYSFGGEDLECEVEPEVVHSLNFDHFHFHEATMTFHGGITNTRPLTSRKPQKESSSYVTDSRRTCCPTYFFQNLECVLQFSPDGKYIRDGYLSWSYFNPPSPEHFPLDGIWEVELEPGKFIQIYVQFHSFSFLDERYHVFINKDNQAWFHWPGSSVVQTSTQKIVPDSSSRCIGETLHWITNTAVRFQWKRICMSLGRVLNVVRMKPIQFVYQKVTTDLENDITLGPTYHARTLWGNTFCQAFTVGLASYHFVQADCDTEGYQAYISYENPLTSQWPNLDNGEAIPSCVPFRNIQWNEVSRTFRGDILWMEDFGTTWTGDSKWSYEMTFDPSFRFVISGTCAMANRDPHQFGKDLIYINAALEVVFREALESSNSTGEYIDILRECRHYGASEATMQCLGEVALSLMNNGEGSCFDLNL